MVEKHPDDISEEKVRLLRAGFKQYLNSEYAHRKDKSTILSDAFYPLRHDIGEDFWNILSSEDAIKRCRERLESFFRNERQKKSPATDAGVYMNSIKILKGFIDDKFGGVDKFIKLSEDELCNKVAVNSNLSQPRQSEIVRSSVASVSRPCCGEVKKYLSRWDGLENYSLQESALNKLFFQTYPNNTDIDDVLIKVSSLNDFYSTNIFSPFQVAKHIISLNIDARLVAGDVTLVNDIAKVTMDNGTVRNFYSFATKYCSHHMPLEFPIYDSYVDRLLRYFRDTDRFFRFSSDDLKDYEKFKNILTQFTNYYRLEPYNLKEIDKYLWQLGKEKFPRTY